MSGRVEDRDRAACGRSGPKNQRPRQGRRYVVTCRRSDRVHRRLARRHPRRALSRAVGWLSPGRRARRPSRKGRAASSRHGLLDPVSRVDGADAGGGPFPRPTHRHLLSSLPASRWRCPWPSRFRQPAFRPSPPSPSFPSRPSSPRPCPSRRKVCCPSR